MKKKISHSMVFSDQLLQQNIKKIALFFLSAFLVCCQLNAQNLGVKGRVTDDKGAPVVGASVVVKGVSAGAITDNQGNFSISVAKGATLVISSVNFLSKEVVVTSNKTLAISLALSNTQLDDVVVIGYGTQRKKDVTGSTVSFKSETINEIKAPNIINQLQGRAAGVDIVNNSTTIGSTGQIRIRGNRSISGSNDPLYIVDGMAFGGSIGDISSENIATIDILKDASATAIYGSRGSNGVIIITTKRGTAQKATTSYSGYVGVVNVLGTYKIFNGQEYAKFKEDARQGRPDYNPANPTAALNPYALTADEQANLAAGVSTDWQRLLITTGIRTSNDVNVRGGNERTQYSFGMGYYRETGVMTDQDLNRYSFNVNIDHKISDRIKAGFSSFSTLTRSNRINTNAYGAAERLSPLVKPYNADGTINFQPAIQQGVDNTQINPLTGIGNDELIKAFARRMQLQNNFYLEFKILNELKFKTTFGYGWSQSFNGNYNGPNTVYNQNRNTAGSTLSQSNSEGWQYTINNSLDFNKTFGGKHKLQVLALQEIQKNHFQSQGWSGQGVPADFIQDYNWQLVNTITAQGGGYSESGLIGYMGRVVYSYNDKYLLTGTVRADASSVLAPGHQWTTYPAVSVGWNIDKENFFKNVKFVSSLKLRAGWGVSSNASIGAYTTLGSLGTSFYNFGSGTAIGTNFVGGYTTNTSPNPNLTWEKTKGLNIGLDFGLFSNRITGSVEYYDNKTTDIIFNKSLPVSNGTNSVLINDGSTASTGIELTLSSTNITTKKGFVWRTDFNAYFNREKITALQNNLQQDIGNLWFVGEPITTIYDYKKTGIWQTKDAAQATVYGVAPGDIQIEDLNNDGKITSADKQIIGNFQPSLVAGLTNHFEFKNFDLNVVMFGRFGQTVVANYFAADGGGAGYPFFLNSRVNQYNIDYWTPTNATNEFPQPDASRDGQQFTSTLTYRDGSFIKVRTIDLGYTLPSKLLSKAKIQSLRVYVSAQNPFILWSPFVKNGFGLDPEGNGTGNAVGAQGGGGGTPGRAITVGMGVPPTRQIIFGVNLKF